MQPASCGSVVPRERSRGDRTERMVYATSGSKPACPPGRTPSPCTATAPPRSGDSRPGKLGTRAGAGAPRGGRGRVPPELLARHPRAPRRAPPRDPRGGGGKRAADRHRRRPARPEAPDRPLRGGADSPRGRPGIPPRPRPGPRQPEPDRLAPSGGVRRARAGDRAAARRRQGPPRGRARRQRPCRDPGCGRRNSVRQQGRQRATGGAADLAADRQGSQGSAVRPRPRGRLDRAQLRAAAGGHRGGAASDRRPRRDHGQGGEALGGRPFGRDHRPRRRDHDRARRSRGRAAARRGSGPAEAHDPRRAGGPASRSWSRPRCWSR